MRRRRSWFKLIVAALALAYAAGATTAALACAIAPLAVHVPMESDCDEPATAPNCALACVPLCAVVTADGWTLPAAGPPGPAFEAPPLRIASLSIAPEPPPPRAG
jgi:hypothetical protein